MVIIPEEAKSAVTPAPEPNYIPNPDLTPTPVPEPATEPELVYNPTTIPKPSVESAFISFEEF